MSGDRIAKENLRRRFQQNQEDCTYTVLALLPTATTRILESMDVEKITLEIQKMKGGNGSKSVKSGSGDSMSLPETTGMTDEDGRSIVSASESGIHASQITVPPASQTEDEQLLQPEKPRRTKRQLWGDVTISSITRAYTLIYTLGLLTMLTRVQLNLLGRRSYLSSVVSLATGSNSATISLENNDDDNSAQAYGDDFEVNRKYLTFSWWLLNKGWVDIAQRVEVAVRQVFGQTKPREQLSLETFAAMTGQVRRLVEGSAAFSDPGTAMAPTKWLAFLLPPPDMEEYVLRESGILDDSAASVTRAQGEESEGQSPPKEEQQQQPPPSSPTSTASLRRLLDETSDLIEAPAFSHVLTQLLDAGFTTLLDTKLAQGAFDIPPPPEAEPSPTSAATAPPPPPTIDATGVAVVGPEQLRLRRRAETKVLLPKCLSVLTRQAHAIGAGAGAGTEDGAPPNVYLHAMESVRDLEGFAALVYSSNWENEVCDEMPAPSTTTATTTTTTTAFGSSVRQSRVLGDGDVEGSLVLVEPSQGSFESAWARATENKAS